MRLPLMSGFGLVTGFMIAVTSPGTAWSQVDSAGGLTDRQLQFFEGKVRPLLVKHCYECHSTEAGKAEGNLLLDSRPGLLEGGDSGPAVVLGDPRRSLLMRAVRYEDLDLAMPPTEAGGKLSGEAIAVFEQWVAMGLPDPRLEATLDASRPAVEASRWWAFQPLQAPDLPEAFRGQDRSAIDYFIGEKLLAIGLKSSPRASTEQLLRRLHFDLTGLPPRLEELQRFHQQAMAASWEAAYRQRVDELLASPQFGVHWGRHWLDIARFAESSGRDINMAYPYAWRYRDYVIDSFNRDKTYADFLRQQLAGDLLPFKTPEERAENLIATGFLAVGSRALNEMNPRQFAVDQADEQIDTVFQATMGLTLACARCHDHKFDPMSQRDYTAVAGIFLSTKTLYGLPGLQNGRNASKPLALPEEAHLPMLAKPISRTAFEDMLAQYRQLDLQLADLQRERLRQFQANTPMTTNANPAREVLQRQQLERQKSQLEGQLMEYDDDGRPVALAMGVVDKPLSSSQSPFARFVGRNLRDRSAFESIADSPFFARGELEMAGDKVRRGVPQLLGNADQFQVADDVSGRLELAAWIVDPGNPLTPRVAVNRIWTWLIGQGLVKSVDNFGTTGSTPSHAELLDYLALSFQSHGSTKQLVREIVLSNSYQQASTYDSGSFEIDPENSYLWRMNPRRLEAESIRDAVLCAAGVLDDNPTIGSSIARRGLGPIDRPPGFLPAAFRRAPESLDADFVGRSIYLGLPRDALPEILSLFDGADATSVQGKRESTNVPSQSLFMLNSDWIAEQSRALAKRVLQTYPGPMLESFEDRLRLVYQLTLCRSPAKEEIAAARLLLSQMGLHPETGWSSLARGLFASAEFRYLD